MPTRDQTGIVLTALAVLVVSYLAYGSSAQTQPPSGSTEAMHRTFQLRVAAYLSVRRGLQGSRPRTRFTDPIQMMFLSRAALASEIRHARAGASQGDIFSPEIATIFRGIIDTALREQLLGEVLAALEGRPDGAVAPMVNGDVPAQATIPMPACLQRAFPPLPPELQYGFLHRDLLLIDVHAGLIVDYVPAAIPSLTE
jgi:hypothetical protein